MIHLFKNSILTLIIIFLGANFLNADLIPKDEALSQFVAGGLAYEDGDYQKGVEKYETILAGGLSNGAVYYNLGNSYFKQKEIGRALLNYERALRLKPRDSDLKFNYKYVRSLVGESADFGSKNFLARILNSHISFYSIDEMSLIIFLLILFSGAFYLLGLYFKWPQKIKQRVLTLSILFLIIFLVGFSLKLQSEKDIAIITQKSGAQFEPREQSTVHFELPSGSKVKIVKTEGDWVKVQRFDDKLGWVQSLALERVLPQT